MRISAAMIEKARYQQKISHPIHIAYDEWNVWFRERDGLAGLEERYTLADALAVGTYLHAFVRHAKAVRMANLAQLVNVIAPIVTSPEGMFLQSIYHPLRLFADHLGTSALDVHVDSETHEHAESPKPDSWPYRVADLGPFPVLDAVATRSAAGELMISVINRSPDTDVTAELRLAGDFRRGPASIEVVNADDWNVVNSFDCPDAVSVREGTIEDLADRTRHTFPAHSHTVISTTVAQAKGAGPA
jgi:alpha-N-arabinofuranosidase